MSDQEKKEQEIMNQEMSQDEMETVAGGGRHVLRDLGCGFAGAYIECHGDLAIRNGRPLYRPDGSVNCAATVEDGSHCGSNDACYDGEVVYLGMKDCHKAWK